MAKNGNASVRAFRACEGQRRDVPTGHCCAKDPERYCVGARGWVAGGVTDGPVRDDDDIALFERREDIALFERHGDQFVPTLFTTGPWRPDAMNGGAPSALVGTVITETVEEGEQVAGVQIDLERPVPLEPLTVVVERRPQSRRISRLNVEVHAASGRVVAAKVLLLRGEPVGTVPSEDVAPPGPDELAPMNWVGQGAGESPTFHVDAIEQRFVEGGFQALGSAVAWLRLRGTVVAGEAPSALAQLLAVADFGSARSPGRCCRVQGWG